MTMWKSVPSMEPVVSGEEPPLLLNFQNHCLLCLQHEDPVVLRQIFNENPKGLVDFQPIMSYLTGSANPFEKGKDNEGGNGNPEGQYYPVTKNLPPLCKLCYDILAELHLFHCELLELQRKIQNQTEAARRIVRGTMRKRGGMRAEFFNRLKIAGIPKGDVESMDLFIGNFHGLILEADQKAVLPQFIPQYFQSPSTVQPYHVQFVEPVPSNTNNASSSPPIRMSAPFQVVSGSTFRVQVAQPEEIDDEVTTSSSSYNHDNHNHVLLVDDEPNPDIAYEYEGDEDREESNDKLEEEEDEDDVVILEDENEGKSDNPPSEVIDALDLDDNDYESNLPNELEEEEDESDEEMDLEYWKSILSSSLIMEQVEEEEDEEQRMEENVEVIQVGQYDDNDEEEEEDLRRSQITPGLLPQEQPMPIILSVRQKKPPSPPPTRTTSSRVRYQCRHCDKNYKALQRLRYHEQEHLPGGRPKPFLCGLCQKGFSTRKLLEQHERVHTGERPFACEICGDRFRQSSTLYRHRMAHKRQQQRLAN